MIPYYYGFLLCTPYVHSLLPLYAMICYAWLPIPSVYVRWHCIAPLCAMSCQALVGPSGPESTHNTSIHLLCILPGSLASQRWCRYGPIRPMLRSRRHVNSVNVNVCVLLHVCITVYVWISMNRSTCSLQLPVSWERCKVVTEITKETVVNWECNEENGKN